MGFWIVVLALAVVALLVIVFIQKRTNKELSDKLTSTKSDLISARNRLSTAQQSVTRLTNDLAAEKKKNNPVAAARTAASDVFSKIATPSVPRPAAPKKTAAPRKSASTSRPQSSSRSSYPSRSSSYHDDGFSNGLLYGALAAGIYDSSNNDSSYGGSSYSDSSSSSSYSSGSDSSSSYSSSSYSDSSSSYSSSSDSGSFSGGDSGSF